MTAPVSTATFVRASAAASVPVATAAASPGCASVMSRQPALRVGVVRVAMVVAFLNRGRGIILVQSVYRHGFFCSGWWLIPVAVLRSSLLAIAVVVLHAIRRCIAESVLYWFISITILLRRAVRIGQRLCRQGLERRTALRVAGRPRGVLKQVIKIIKC